MLISLFGRWRDVVSEACAWWWGTCSFIHRATQNVLGALLVKHSRCFSKAGYFREHYGPSNRDAILFDALANHRVHFSKASNFKGYYAPSSRNMILRAALANNKCHFSKASDFRGLYDSRNRNTPCMMQFTQVDCAKEFTTNRNNNRPQDDYILKKTRTVVNIE